MTIRGMMQVTNIEQQSHPTQLRNGQLSEMLGVEVAERADARAACMQFAGNAVDIVTLRGGFAHHDDRHICAELSVIERDLLHSSFG